MRRLYILKKEIDNSLPVLKKILFWMFPIGIIAFIAIGSYGLFGLMGHLDSMGNSDGRNISINKHLFSTPIFLILVPVVVRVWKKSMFSSAVSKKNSIAASLAIYLSIFIIGGMVSRTIFAEKAENYGYIYCSTTTQQSLTVWAPQNRCQPSSKDNEPVSTMDQQ